MGILTKKISGPGGMVTGLIDTCITKEGVTLKWENEYEADVMKCGSAQINYLCDTTNQIGTVSGKNIRSLSLEKQLNDELKKLKELPMQGRLIDNNSGDYLLSQHIYRNYKFNDQLPQFWYNAKRNVIKCNYTLSLRYDNADPKCQLCNYPLESMAHVLNGCKKLRDNYSVRHNVIVNKISEELNCTLDGIYMDKTIKTSFKEDFENLENVEELKLKPDIVAKSGHLVNIIGIACPYDLYVESLYTKKIEKFKSV